MPAPETMKYAPEAYRLQPIAGEPSEQCRAHAGDGADHAEDEVRLRKLPAADLSVFGQVMRHPERHAADRESHRGHAGTVQQIALVAKQADVIGEFRFGPAGGVGGRMSRRMNARHPSRIPGGTTA